MADVFLIFDRNCFLKTHDAMFGVKLLRHGPDRIAGALLVLVLVVPGISFDVTSTIIAFLSVTGTSDECEWASWLLFFDIPETLRTFYTVCDITR